MEKDEEFEKDNEFWSKQRKSYEKVTYDKIRVHIPCGEKLPEILAIFINPSYEVYDINGEDYVAIVFNFTIKYTYMKNKLIDIGVDVGKMFETGGFRK